MKRRTWLLAWAGLLSPKLKADSPGVLKPLDEAGFRGMVEAHRGSVLLVDFWATWCAPCREELPKLVSFSATRSDKSFHFVTISCDEPEQEKEAAQFLDSNRAPRPYYIKRASDDEDFINKIDSKWSGALPALFLFDRSGKQAGAFIGETDIKTVEAAVQRAASSK